MRKFYSFFSVILVAMIVTSCGGTNKKVQERGIEDIMHATVDVLADEKSSWDVVVRFRKILVFAGINHPCYTAAPTLQPGCSVQDSGHDRVVRFGLVGCLEVIRRNSVRKSTRIDYLNSIVIYCKTD